MRRPSPLVTFVLSAFGWIIVLTALWSQVSPWTSYPVGVLSHIALEQGAPKTPFMAFGDTVRIEMLDADGVSIFGAIEQVIERQALPA